jgi:hypothetical protein
LVAFRSALKVGVYAYRKLSVSLCVFRAPSPYDMIELNTTLKTTSEETTYVTVVWFLLGLSLYRSR